MVNTPTTSTSTGGGSAAGQAYREDMARKGEAVPDTAVAAAPATTAQKDARASVRKKVSGKARIAFPGSTSRTGKLVDLSEQGVCVLMDDSMPHKTVCTLECDIFQGGKHVRFSTPVLSVYSVLASGMGFKIGFQWGALDARAAESIQSLMRAP